MIYEVRRLQPDWQIGFDLLSQTAWRSSPNDRTLSGIALTGGLQAGDIALEVFVGDTRTGVLYNSSAGVPSPLMDEWRSPMAIPGGSILTANLMDFPDNAGADTAIYLALDLRTT